MGTEQRRRPAGRRRPARLTLIAIATLALAGGCSSPSAGEAPGRAPGSPAVTRSAGTSTASAGQGSTPSPAATVSADTAPIWRHTPVSATDLARAARKRVFFGHQSVGGNIMKGVTALYKANGASAPPFVDITAGGSTSLPGTGGYLAHAFIGENGDPLAKIADFDAILRAGVGGRVDVALMKLCYADITAKSDVVGVFDRYAAVMAGLEREFPNVRFLYSTVPLKTNRPADNIARAAYNELVRQEYRKTGRLYDIAAIESTDPDGTRVSGVEGGSAFDSLFGGYSTDGGHLNEVGTRMAAAPLLQLVADGKG